MISKLRDESGSAIVEFVALAIPLFIPIFIYLNSFASVSANEAIVRVMAREGVRAYAASDSDHSGRVVSEQAILLIAQNLGLTSKEINTCLLYTSPSPRDRQKSRMPSSA